MQKFSTRSSESSPKGLRRHLTESAKSLFKSAVAGLKGSARCVFMAETIRKLGAGGQSLAKREFGQYNRGAIRKEMRELSSLPDWYARMRLMGRK